MKRLVILAAAGALVLAACGDDDGGAVREIDGGSGSASASGSGSGSGSGSATGSASGVGAECVPVGDGSAADSTVDVSIADFEVQPDPQTATAGLVRFEVTNGGSFSHEVVVIKAPLDALESKPDGSLDEEALPSDAIIGEIEPIAPDATCEGTFELSPGDYSLACNIVEDDESATSHYAEGMRASFTVTG